MGIYGEMLSAQSGASTTGREMVGYAGDRVIQAEGDRTSVARQFHNSVVEPRRTQILDPPKGVTAPGPTARYRHLRSSIDLCCRPVYFGGRFSRNDVTPSA